jgi:hypothetical protein
VPNRWRRRERWNWLNEEWDCAADGEERDRIRKSREEGQMGFSKGVYAKSENCRGLFVKQNFPLI